MRYHTIRQVNLNRNISFAEMNCLPAAKQHFYVTDLLRTISKAQLARKWNVSEAAIRIRVRMLDGIDSRAVDLLSDKIGNPLTYNVMRHMSSSRQIAAAHLMIASANFTVPFAMVLLASTKRAELRDHKRKKTVANLSQQQVRMIEQGMAKLERSAVNDKAIIDGAFQSVLLAGFLRRLLGNPRIRSYLAKAHPSAYYGFGIFIDLAPASPRNFSSPY